MIMQVDLVTFGVAVVGDETFTQDLARVVNARHLRFVGEGHMQSELDGHDLYLLGDLTAEVGRWIEQA
jgi:hypothetical protein